MRDVQFCNGDLVYIEYYISNLVITTGYVNYFNNYYVHLVKDYDNNINDIEAVPIDCIILVSKLHQDCDLGI